MMKPLIFALLLCGTCAAQDFYEPLPFTDPEEETPSGTPRVEYFEVKQPVDGILIRVLRTINPLRLIDPRAPEEFGRGEDTVSRDPNDPEQKPRGFILLSRNW